METKFAEDAAKKWAAQVHKVSDAAVIDIAQAAQPGAGSIWRLRMVSAGDPNGATLEVLIDERGRTIDATPERAAQFALVPATVVRSPLAAVERPPITISPDTNTLVLEYGDTLDEILTVTVPKNPRTRADIYFLADTTGSMTGILAAVQAGAAGVLTMLDALGMDLAYGVGDYKDFLSGDPYAFHHALSPTPVSANALSAINLWSASGGGDFAEAAFNALHTLAEPAGGAIGWRADSERIIVWFGDAPAHDPTCPAVSGLADPITEASVTQELVDEGIAVLAISVATPGLDDDPRTSPGYTAACGTAGGLPGQATRIAAATGGVFVTGIDPSTIADTIARLITAALSSISRLKLVPSASIAPFIGSLTPVDGYGPLSGDVEHKLPFAVRFHGIPCKPEAQVFTGTIDVVADGAVVAAKRVHITVPPCNFVYSVKFVCGEQPASDCHCAPLRPGKYATEINIHNPYLTPVVVTKRFVPLVLAGAPVGREPRVGLAGAVDRIELPPHGATMDDCCRITEMVYGAPGASSAALTVGFLEITCASDIVVTAVYTASGAGGDGMSMEVVQVASRRS